MGRVVVVGSINVDLVADVPHLPAAGETVLAGSLARHHGGKGANAAVAAARAGASVTMLGAVGRDADGDAALAALDAEGVEVRYIARADAPTGTGLVAVDTGGANQIVVAPGANAALLPEDVAVGMARDGAAGDVLLCSLEVPLTAVEAAVRAARGVGMTVVLNPAPVRELPDELLADGVCTPNRGELAGLSGTDDLAEAAARLIARGMRAVVVTLGDAGAVVWEASGHTAFPAAKTTVVDTTGAGDCFSGVLVASLAEGLPLHAAAERANVAAGLSVTAAGARGGLPDRAAIDRALAARRKPVPPG
jgi:ribokinase